MTSLEALLLGIVQGITEFFPVSSSGHLKLVQYFLGLENLDRYIIFDLVCHLGTLLAVLVVFCQPIKEVLVRSASTFGRICIGTLPLFPLLALMKPIKAAYADPSTLGFFFLLTALILFVGCRFGKTAYAPLASPVQSLERYTRRDALFIGIWQAVAILPGVSRSGSTISGARLLGWQPSDAVTFSFLLAIPAICGGVILECFKVWQAPDTAIALPASCYCIGFAVSFATGLLALQTVRQLAVKGQFSYFAWYCLFLGLATLWYFNPKNGS